MPTTEQPPAAWQVALERFRGGYGSDFDANDATDVFLFMPLLETAVEDKITREMILAFHTATEQARAELRALRERP